MSKIIVVSDDSGCMTNVPVSIPEVADIFCSAITAMVAQIKPKIMEMSDEDSSKVSKELFDCLNHSFSKCLENSFPEQELRPDITEQAIYELENQIITEEAAALDNIVQFGKPE